MAKKKPTAKQLAARRKFAAIMRSGGFKKHRKKSRSVKRKSHKRRKVSAIKTVSRSHTDKNRITANIQVGSLTHLKSALRNRLNDRLKDLLFKRDQSTTMKAYRRYGRSITEVKRQLRNL